MKNMTIVTGPQAQDWVKQAVHRDDRPSSFHHARAFLMCTHDVKNDVMEWTGTDGVQTILCPAYMAAWPERSIRYGIDLKTGILAVELVTSKTLMVYRMACLDGRNNKLSPEVALEIGREIIDALG